MSETDGNEIIHPRLHHLGLTTAHQELLVDWYAKVLGTDVTHESSHPLGPDTPPGVTAAWVTNDGANHRIGIIGVAALTDDRERIHHHRLQHIAFEYPSIDDLLSTYKRLKTQGIEPVLSADHGPTTSLYYQDPDRNSVELLVDNFGDWATSKSYMETAPEFAAKPFGTYVDPEGLIAARNAGVPVAELHRRAYAGEYPPARPIDPTVVM